MTPSGHTLNVLNSLSPCLWSGNNTNCQTNARFDISIGKINHHLFNECLAFYKSENPIKKRLQD